jgi:hypothetical protein
VFCRCRLCGAAALETGTKDEGRRTKGLGGKSEDALVALALVIR